jgi:hypothetical protein
MIRENRRLEGSPLLFTLLATLVAACAPAEENSEDPSASVRPHLMPPGVPAEYAATPQGYFDPSCMTEVHAGETVLADGSIKTADGSVRGVGACTKPHFDPAGRIAPAGGEAGTSPPPPSSAINGWVENYSSTATGPLSALSATWIVPEAPSTPGDGQVIYFFNGLEGLPTVESILQPVLGFYDGQWTATSWNCCKAGTTYHASSIDVSPGDLLVGTVTGTGCDASTGLCGGWSIETLDQNTGESSVLSTSAWGVAENWVFAGVLEAYGVSACSDLPASGQLSFDNQAFTTVSGAGAQPDWQLSVGQLPVTCGYGGTAQGSSVTLDFGSSAPGGAGAVALGGSYTFEAGVSPTSCLDVYADDPANYTQIDEYTCNGTAAQTFTVTDAGNGLVTLQNPGSGRCVDLYAAGTSDGTKVELYDCNGTAAQQFAVESDGSGDVTFMNPNSGKCLDVQSSGTANYTKVQLWDCNGTSAQKWHPVNGGLTVGGSYTFHTLVNPSSCLDVYGDGPANYTQIEEYACNGSAAQAFTVVDAGGGRVSLLHASSGRCVDIYAAGTSDGTKVELYDCNGTAAQQFVVETDASGDLTFVNPNSGKCLDVQGSGTANLTKVQLWDCNGTNAQKWQPEAG